MSMGKIYDFMSYFFYKDQKLNSSMFCFQPPFLQQSLEKDIHNTFSVQGK